MLLFLIDHWPWLALAYLVAASCALALCRAAKRGDEASERALRALHASEGRPARTGPQRHRARAREAHAPGSPA
jgi:hypothetical protein